MYIEIQKKCVTCRRHQHQFICQLNGHNQHTHRNTCHLMKPLMKKGMPFLIKCVAVSVIAHIGNRDLNFRLCHQYCNTASRMHSNTPTDCSTPVWVKKPGPSFKSRRRISRSIPSRHAILVRGAPAAIWFPRTNGQKYLGARLQNQTTFCAERAVADAAPEAPLSHLPLPATLPT